MVAHRDGKFRFLSHICLFLYSSKYKIFSSKIYTGAHVLKTLFNILLKSVHTEIG
jgi:hypothetical protein